MQSLPDKFEHGLLTSFSLRFLECDLLLGLEIALLLGLLEFSLGDKVSYVLFPSLEVHSPFGGRFGVFFSDVPDTISQPTSACRMAGEAALTATKVLETF
jgi:hypothetical protein